MSENYNENLNNETFGVERTFTPEVFMLILSPEEIAKNDENRKLTKTSKTIGKTKIYKNYQRFFSIVLTVQNSYN